VFQFSGEAGRAVVLTVLGSDDDRLRLDPYFVVVAPNGEILDRNNFAIARTSQDRRVHLRLPQTGTYEIYVISDFTNPNQAGRFSLALQNDTNRYVLDESGVLSASSPRLRSDNSPISIYEIRGNQGDTLRALASSPDFDSFLFLIDAEGRIVATDDDSGGNYHAYIDTVLPRDGTYTIVVNALDSNAQGRYRLTVSIHR
jgi:serine protease Do